jgi:hypothetical protein
MGFFRLSMFAKAHGWSRPGTGRFNAGSENFTVIPGRE